MRFPKAICLLGPTDRIACQVCDGKGSWSIHEVCCSCGGSGNRPHATDSVCPKCGGSGLYDRDRNLPCFSCNGVGRVAPKCRNCYGVGSVIVESKSCAACDGSGTMLVSQTLGVYGTAKDIQNVVEVMRACMEEAELITRARGEQLYNLLRDTYRHARKQGSEQARKLFPDELSETIRVAVSRSS